MAWSASVALQYVDDSGMQEVYTVQANAETLEEVWTRAVKQTEGRYKLNGKKKEA